MSSIEHMSRLEARVTCFYRSGGVRSVNVSQFIKCLQNVKHEARSANQFHNFDL